MSKKEDDLPTEDGDSDRYDGVEEEPEMSKGSRDFFDNKMDHKSIYKLRTIKAEPKSTTDWQRDYMIMALKKT